MDRQQLPLPKWRTLYTSGVYVFCAKVEPFNISVAFTGPITQQEYADKDNNYVRDLHEKVLHNLRLCDKQGHRHIVIGAWGCGNSRNQPADVATVFREALSIDFNGCFQQVVFAIRQDETHDVDVFQIFQNFFAQ